MFVTVLFFATSLRVTVNATHFPSGDTFGPLTRDSFCISSTWNECAANAGTAQNKSESTPAKAFIFPRTNLTRPQTDEILDMKTLHGGIGTDYNRLAASGTMALIV